MPIFGLGNSVSNANSSFGPSAPVYDADAQAFFTAVGGLTLPEQAAINTFVLGLKADAIWTPLITIWPLVGNQTAQRYNLRNTATGLITWSSAPGSHNSATGFTPAAGEYGNTNLFGSSSSTMGAYLRTSSTNTSNFLMGSNHNDHYLIARDGTQSAKLGASPLVTATNATALGLFSTGRIGTSVLISKNGAILNSGVGIGSLAATNVFVGAANNSGAAHQVSVGLSFGLFFISSYLDPTQLTNFYNRVQALQTSLGRQV